MPAQSQPISDEEMLNEGEYDDVWPVRPASSARRYQGLSDVRHETGRSADIQAQVGPRAAARSTGERHTIPPRRTAMQTRLPTRTTTSEFEEAPPTTTI